MVQAGLSMHAVEYLPGSPGSSLVISAPHDGEMKPASIPTRQNGCQTESGGCDFKPSCTGKRSIACRATSVQDLYTKDIARELQATIGRLTGLMPHLIVSHLARSKLDPNRPVEEAAQYNPAAIRAWTDFHGYIQTAHTAVQSNGPGLHIDIHGACAPTLTLKKSGRGKLLTTILYPYNLGPKPSWGVRACYLFVTSSHMLTRRLS